MSVLLGSVYATHITPVMFAQLSMCAIVATLLIIPILLFVLSRRHRGTKLGLILRQCLIFYIGLVGFCFVSIPFVITGKMSQQEEELAAKKLELEMKMQSEKGHHER
jgi:hypothetical protein